MFYAVLALLTTHKKETSKHSGAISLFDKEFVRTGVFTKEFSRWLHDAFDLRQRSDYAARVQVSKEEASQMLGQARAFVAGVRKKLMD